MSTKLPRQVWIFGWVSLATDAASEAIYPLLPFFLTQVLGAGAFSLGVVEGAAEAANSLLKIASGRLADRAREKRWLVLAGYGVSSAIRPFIAVARSWTAVLAIRVTDRVGKGVRGAPRDAMLAGFATEHSRGRVFGFHRAMDHLGAVVGPVLASFFLLAYPNAYRTLFALTIVPGAIAVALIFLIHEQPRSVAVQARPANAGGAAPRLDKFPPQFVQFMAVLALFTLGNSTDAFLLLRLSDIAHSVVYVPLMWAGLHVVKAGVSLVGGDWSDRVGRRTVIAGGWLVYATVYAGFAMSESLAALLAWFFVYGVYFGLAEGTERALVADLAPASRRGIAFGIYDAVTGLGALAASLLFGAIWTAWGAPTAFATGAGLAVAATTLLFAVI
jgi:MFS family permease